MAYRYTIKYLHRFDCHNIGQMYSTPCVFDSWSGAASYIRTLQYDVSPAKIELEIEEVNRDE